MRELGLLKRIDRLESVESLDPLVDTVRTAVRSVVRWRGLRDLLHGVPLGHPLHPTLVQLPVSAWVSAGVLDAVAGTERASRMLVGLGVLGALPSAAAGTMDLSQLRPQQARIGIIHAAANVLAVALYSASYLQRHRGRHGSGKVLGYLGLAVVSGSGFLGAHLSFRKAAGANHAEGVPPRFPRGWQSLGALDTLPENELIGREIGGQPLAVLRRGSTVEALAGTCTHLSGPLSEGTLVSGDEGEACVQCPWHGSVFSMRTGEVVHGPATAPEPRLQTRVRADMVEVLMPGAG